MIFHEASGKSCLNFWQPLVHNSLCTMPLGSAFYCGSFIFNELPNMVCLATSEIFHSMLVAFLCIYMYMIDDLLFMLIIQLFDEVLHDNLNDV